MFEFIFLSVLLVLVVWFLCRRGAARLRGTRVKPVFMLVGLTMGAVIDTLPLSHVGGRFTLRTVLLAAIGLFVGRFLARAIAAWAEGYRTEDIGDPAERARLVHPLIGVGLALSGIFILHEVVTARHLTLETENPAVAANGGVLPGAEEVRLDVPGADHAVLLLHGFLGSPADLGDLPQALHERGLAVHAPRLPGHGETPDALLDVTAEQLLDASRAAYDALAADHEHVSVVGFSVGGALAALLAAERPVERLVLVNPYAGRVQTPWFSPFATDDLVVWAAKITRHVIRPPGIERINLPAGRERMRTYHTVPLAPALQTHAIARLLDDAEPAAPRGGVLMLTSRTDHTLPPDVAIAFYRDRYGSTLTVETFDRSDHVMLLDYDADAAIQAIVDDLTAR